MRLALNTSLAVSLGLNVVLFVLWFGGSSTPAPRPAVAPRALRDSASDDGCPTTLEKTFVETIARIEKLRKVGHVSIGADCPSKHQFGFRPMGMAPTILGTKCEPWWRREAITLVDRLVSSDMVGLEWGSGTSSMWMALRIKLLYVAENTMEYYEMLKRSMTELGYSDHVKYVELPKNMRDASRIHLDALDGKKMDFISVDGSEGTDRPACFKNAIKNLLKENGGIILWDNTNRKHYKPGLNSAPKHWLRYDTSAEYPSHWPVPRMGWDYGRGYTSNNITLTEITREDIDKWVVHDFLQTTIFISRTEECAAKSIYHTDT